MNSFIGRVYDSNNFGKFKIISEVDKNETKDRRFEIEFLDTGYKTISSYTAIRHGNVKDKMFPNIAGVGFIGSDIKITADPITFALYKVWNDMINRCYNTNDYDYYLYGAIGIKVEESWFNFSTFLNDSKQLPGYNFKLEFPEEYQLDKDYLQLHIPKEQRIYSKSTCMWISKFDNIMIMNRDNPINSGYYGVIYKDNAYCTRLNNICYGQFIIPEAAATLFNYIYPFFRDPFNDIIILNNVNIPLEDLEKYVIPERKGWFNDYLREKGRTQVSSE